MRRFHGRLRTAAFNVSRGRVSRWISSDEIGWFLLCGEDVESAGPVVDPCGIEFRRAASEPANQNASCASTVK